jgi:hypothetical protein
VHLGSINPLQFPGLLILNFTEGASTVRFAHSIITAFRNDIQKRNFFVLNEVPPDLAEPLFRY